jgi:hypothetical protein
VLRAAFAEARGIAEALEASLRLRIFIGPSAPELHGLYWETLRDLDGDAHLPMSERVLYHRHPAGDCRRAPDAGSTDSGDSRV